jgi:hypothetical protein
MPSRRAKVRASSSRPSSPEADAGRNLRLQSRVADTILVVSIDVEVTSAGEWDQCE